MEIEQALTQSSLTVRHMISPHWRPLDDTHNHCPVSSPMTFCVGGFVVLVISGSQCVFCAEEEVMVRSGAQMTRGLCGTESLKLIPRLYGCVPRLTLAPLWKPNVIGIVTFQTEHVEIRCMYDTLSFQHAFSLIFRSQIIIMHYTVVLRGLKKGINENNTWTQMKMFWRIWVTLTSHWERFTWNKRLLFLYCITSGSGVWRNALVKYSEEGRELIIEEKKADMTSQCCEKMELQEWRTSGERNGCGEEERTGDGDQNRPRQCD